MRILPSLLLLCGLITTANANFMSYVWPQKQLTDRQIGNPNASQKILIAGASSEFKDTIITRLSDSLKNEGAFVKVIGLMKLTKEDPKNYSAVVVVNTCMAWEIDGRANGYFRKHDNYKKFIVLTTSGDPDSCGPSKKLPQNIDAISSASLMNKADKLVNQILAAVRKK